jgi:hypothetical protein
MERPAATPDHVAIPIAHGAAMHSPFPADRRPIGDDFGDAPALSSCDPDRPGADERYAGGWFDSSLELRQGLEITEYMSFAALARELPANGRLG